MPVIAEPTRTGEPDLTDAQRRAELKRMKLVASGLLMLAALVFIFARVQEESNSNWGYLRAFAEAAMVGALADWFAVTALFRHPLGIPIPHTAIIKKRKDQIGASLGSFVRDNFLSRDVITEQLADAELGRRVGDWLAEPTNAREVGEQSAAVVRGVTEVLEDQTVQAGLEDVLQNQVRSIPMTPFVGRAIDVAVEGEYHQTLLEATLTGVERFIDENHSTFRAKLYEESPRWVPEAVDDVVFDKISEVVSRFLGEVARDRHHPLREHLDDRTAELSRQLKSNPELIARGEHLKEELLQHPEVRAWSSSLWARIKAGLLDASENPDSELRRQLESALVDAGRSLQTDAELRARIDDWATGAAGYVAEQFRGEVAALISSTVERWDADETADRLELQVGRDLQFIRINGTIVGGIAGLVIYTLSELFI